jgi:hypothetical protein
MFYKTVKMQKVNKATENVNLSPCLSTINILGENTMLLTPLILALEGGEKSTSHISCFTTVSQWPDRHLILDETAKRKISNIAFSEWTPAVYPKLVK